MVSDYLKHTHSLEELDDLFERDRLAAAKVAAAVLKHEVQVAVTNISEINQVANARIVANSQVASAKMMTNAEVVATQLTAKAELAILEIRQHTTTDGAAEEAQSGMISEISRIATDDISDSAKKSIKDIQDEDAQAIEASEERILGAKNAALGRINEVVEAWNRAHGT